jgi:hypothetical protein
LPQVHGETFNNKKLRSSVENLGRRQVEAQKLRAGASKLEAELQTERARAATLEAEVRELQAAAKRAEQQVVLIRLISDCCGQKTVAGCVRASNTRWSIRTAK